MRLEEEKRRIFGSGEDGAGDGHGGEDGEWLEERMMEFFGRMDWLE